MLRVYTTVQTRQEFSHSSPLSSDGAFWLVSCKDVDLISPLSHIAEQTFNGIGALNVAVHRLRKGIKGQEVLFILSQPSHRFPDSAEHTWL